MKTFMYLKRVKVYKNVPQNYFGEISISLLDISTQNKLKQIFSNRLRVELIINVHVSNAVAWIEVLKFSK